MSMTDLQRLEALKKAREIFTTLETNDLPYGYSTLQGFHRDLMENLTKSGQSYAALDESGQSSNEQMRERVNEAVARCHILSARNEYLNLLSLSRKNGQIHNALYVDSTANTILAHIHDAKGLSPNASLASLDETGKTSERDMVEQFEASVLKAKTRGQQELSIALSTRSGFSPAPR